MGFDLLRDFANEANRDIGAFRLTFTLSPDNMRRDDYDVAELNWDSINFGDSGEIGKIPDDKRGIYALSVCHPNNHLSPHGYVIYIGIAGRRSDRPLRDRYKDYLNEKRVHKERPALAYAIGNWQNVLRFFFAPVDDAVSSEDLEKLEEQINTALMPPYSFGDLEAETKRIKKAFV